MVRTVTGPSGPSEFPASRLQVSLGQVRAFRLARHQLLERAAFDRLNDVLASINGAQAQLLSAAGLSTSARVGGLRPDDIDRGLWERRTLVRAWCMRRTMYLLPAGELALYARGTTRRADREVRWMQGKGVPRERLNPILDDLLEVLGEPRTRTEIARQLAGRHGHRMSVRRGGDGWGGARSTAWLDVAGVRVPVGYLLHLVGSRGVVCVGPADRGRATYVRADAWVPGWRDMPVERAEGELLGRYLSAFGPATPADFAVWTGMGKNAAGELFENEAPRLARVEVDGRPGWCRRQDLYDLDRASPEPETVRLLPYFDAYLLGHAQHDDLVDPELRPRVYRPQGWVAPTLLVDGRVAGTWSLPDGQDGSKLRLTPFVRLGRATAAQVREEARLVGAYLGRPAPALVIGPIAGPSTGLRASRGRPAPRHKPLERG